MTQRLTTLGHCTALKSIMFILYDIFYFLFFGCQGQFVCDDNISELLITLDISKLAQSKSHSVPFGCGSSRCNLSSKCNLQFSTRSLQQMFKAFLFVQALGSCCSIVRLFSMLYMYYCFVFFFDFSCNNVICSLLFIFYLSFFLIYFNTYFYKCYICSYLFVISVGC